MRTRLDNMKIIRSSSMQFIPASHENPLDPGVLKKVLFTHADILPGQIQMVNWAQLLPQKSFQRHYHENMQEVFILLSGKVEMNLGSEKEIMEKGDAVIVPIKATHTMRNLENAPAEFIVFGISVGEGKTVLSPK